MKAVAAFGHDAEACRRLPANTIPTCQENSYVVHLERNQPTVE